MADASTAQPILSITHPTYPNHNGGLVMFGPDGYLYIGVGDGGGGDPSGNAPALHQRILSAAGARPRRDGRAAGTGHLGVTAGDSGVVAVALRDVADLEIPAIGIRHVVALEVLADHVRPRLQTAALELAFHLFGIPGLNAP